MLVADSLRKRNGFTIQQGLDLWVHYNRILLHYARKKDVPLIEFDSDFDVLGRSIDALIELLELPNPKNGITFLETNLYNKLQDDRNIPAGPRQLYANLRKLQFV